MFLKYLNACLQEFPEISCDQRFCLAVVLVCFFVQKTYDVEVTSFPSFRILNREMFVSFPIKPLIDRMLNFIDVCISKGLISNAVLLFVFWNFMEDQHDESLDVQKYFFSKLIKGKSLFWKLALTL